MFYSHAALQVRLFLLGVTCVALSSSGCRGKTERTLLPDEVDAASDTQTSDEGIDAGSSNEFCVEFLQEQVLSRLVVEFVVDVSPSMETLVADTDEDRLQTVQGALRNSYGDFSGLATFPDDDGCFAEADAIPLEPNSSLHAERFAEVLQALSTRSQGAPLVESLDFAYREVERGAALVDPRDNVSKYVVLFTDGGSLAEADCGDVVSDLDGLANAVNQAGERGMSTLVIAFEGSAIEREALMGVPSGAVSVYCVGTTGSCVEDLADNVPLAPPYCPSCGVSAFLGSLFQPEVLQVCDIQLPSSPEGQAIDIATGEVVLVLADDSTRNLTADDWAASESAGQWQIQLSAEACELMRESRALEVRIRCNDE